MRKTDAHVHIYERISGYGWRGELRPVGGGIAEWANGDLHRLIPEQIGGTGFSAEQMVSLMDGNGIEKAVILQGNLYGFQNLYIRDTIRKYPGRLTGACAVDPFARSGPEILKKLLDEDGFRACKFEFSDACGLMSFHDPFALDSERMFTYYRLLEERNAVLVVDIGSAGMKSYQPDAVAEIARCFPKLQIVVCHLMAHRSGEAAALEKELEILKHDQIFFDLAAVPWNACPNEYPFEEALKYIRLAADIVGAGRLMWGSDLPGVILESSYAQLTDYLENSELFTQEEKKMMFSGTAERVYFRDAQQPERK